MKLHHLIAAMIFLATALPIDAARPVNAARPIPPASCAVFKLDSAFYSYVNCALRGVRDLNARPWGWLAFVAALAGAAFLAGRGYTLPRRTAWNALILTAAVGVFALYGYFISG